MSGEGEKPSVMPAVTISADHLLEPDDAVESEEEVKEGGNGLGSGGGKNCGGGWGQWSDDLHAASMPLSTDDPMYESDDADSACPKHGSVDPNLDWHKQQFRLVVADYFTDPHVDEMEAALSECDPKYNPVLVKMLVSVAMDGKSDRFELASELLAKGDLIGLQWEHVEQGFCMLLESVSDLRLDVPAAAELLSLFIARAIVDGAVRTEWLDTATSSLANNDLICSVVLAKAREMLKGRQSYNRHARLISSARRGQLQSVESLKMSIRALITEYIDSEDLAEAARCIWELDSPHFHHEVVKRLVVLSVDQNSSKQQQMFKLLQRVATITSIDQIMTGFRRVFDELQDLQLDSPNAASTVTWLVQQSIAKGILPCSFAAAAPEAISSKLEVPTLSVLHAASRSLDEVTLGEAPTAAIQQLMIDGSISEFARVLEHINQPHLHTEVIRAMLHASFYDPNSSSVTAINRLRELVSSCIVQLHSQQIFCSTDIEDALVGLLDSLDTSMIDYPSSCEVLTVFVARMVVDECLPPVVIRSLAVQHKTGSCASSVLARAQVMLSDTNRLELVTGYWASPSLPPEEVEQLKSEIRQILQEFILSCDIEATIESLEELNMSYMWHEVIKRAVILSFDGTDETKARVSALLCYLSAHGLVFEEQMKMGFELIIAEFDELLLDVPDAARMLALMLCRAQANGCLSSIGHMPVAVQEHVDALNANTGPEKYQ